MTSNLLLSKSTAPCLDLGEEFFHQNFSSKFTQTNSNDIKSPLELDALKKQSFFNFINEVLETRKKLLREQGYGSSLRSLKKLHLFVPNLCLTPPHVAQNRAERWILNAVTEFILEELELVGSYLVIHGDGGFEFPEAIRLAQHLKSLSLTRVKYDHQMNSILAKSCPRIESLSFVECQLIGYKRYLEIEHPNLRSFRYVGHEPHACEEPKCVLKVGDCRKLKVLELRYVKLFGELFKVGHLLKLRDLDLEDCCLTKYVKISSQSLERVKLIHSFTYQTCQVELDACKELRQLEISNVTLIKESLDSSLTCIRNLEILNLQYCQFSHRTRISSQCLKNLSLRYTYNLVELEIDAPNLTDFTFRLDNDNGYVPLLMLRSFHPKKTTLELGRLLSKDVNDANFGYFFRQLHGYSQFMDVQIMPY